MDGEQIKLSRLLAIQERGIEHNAIALALPPYRKLVRSVTSALIPAIQEYITEAQSKRGRPGTNRSALPYITEVGIEKCCALAVSSLVNNFTRPITYQTLVGKIGQTISYEWGILQEDPAVVDKINKSIHKGSVTSRRYVYLSQYIKKKYDRGVAYIPTVPRNCIGDLFLSHLLRINNLLQKQRIKTGKHTTQTLITAHPILIQWISDELRQSAHDNPLSLPHLEPVPADHRIILKPQRGHHTPESTTTPDSYLVRAANKLNNVAFKVNIPQLEFIRELSRRATTTLGIPGHQQPEMPPYLEGATPEQIQAVRSQRAKAYADGAMWRSKRTALLTHLGLLQQYTNKEVYFEVEADFRGRIYPTANALSYQGPDWIRSIWKFSEGAPIYEENEEWLYVHAASCFGLSRLSYGARVLHMRGLHDQMRALVADPIEQIGFLEQAKEPFRFLAAAREIVEYLDHGPGYVSHLPVFIDASSQGIQIHAALLEDIDLMKASNVLPSEDEPQDIYTELAQIVNDDASSDTSQAAAWVRQNPVDRKTAKRIMMLIPYGGKLHAAFKTTRDIPNIPSDASVWLAKKLYDTAVDMLHTLVKFQDRAAQAVTEKAMESGSSSYSWSSPCDVEVRQTYDKQKIKRIQTAIRGHLYSYKVGTGQPNYSKLGAAFVPNFTHSLDASLLCRAVVDSSYPICTIHDSIGILAAHVDDMQTRLAEAFNWVILEGRRTLHSLNIPTCGTPKFFQERGQGPSEAGRYTKYPKGLSSYLFS